MFYFDKFKDTKILKSNYINNVTAYFTTRGEIQFPDTKRIIRPTQTHSDNVEIVDSRLDYPDTDSLILTNREDTICLKFADCTPLIFYDNIANIGAIAHAGWRGTASKIGIKTAQKMIELGCLPQNITVLIGPAISLCCYEVSEDIKEKLLATVSNSNGLYKNRNVDLKRINARQLMDIGINKIDICPYCTSCNNNLFYSYRKENGTQERHYAILNLSAL